MKKAVCLAEQMPEELSKEVSEFIQRNTFSEMAQNQHSRGAFPPCCPHCLKAHIIKTARKVNLKDEEVAQVLLGIKGEAGHNGYYLDGESVVKI